MKTIFTVIKTIIAIGSILAGLTALFTIDNANGVTSLLFWAFTIIAGLGVGITILITTFPKYFNDDEENNDGKTALTERYTELIEEHTQVISDKTECLSIIDVLVRKLVSNGVVIDEVLMKRIENQIVGFEDMN